MSKYFLSDVLKDIRSKNNLTQEEFAKELGIGIATLKNAERGKTSLPNAAFLSSLAEFCSEHEIDLLKRILYSGYGYPFVLDTNNVDDLELPLLDHCKYLLALYTVNLYFFDKMTIMTELTSTSVEYHELWPVECIYSCLKKGHNPSTILVPVVVTSEPAFLGNLFSPLYIAVASNIISEIENRFNITDRHHIEVAFIVDISMKEIESDPNSKHLFKFLTEKQNKSYFSFIFCDTLNPGFIHRYYKRDFGYL